MNGPKRSNCETIFLSTRLCLDLIRKNSVVCCGEQRRVGDLKNDLRSIADDKGSQKNAASNDVFDFLKSDPLSTLVGSIVEPQTKFLH